MADPLSALGLGIGAASLIMQITDECIKGYKYFTEATQMSESYRYLRVRVQVEQQRFLSFAMEAGLLYADGNVCASLRVNHMVLQNALREINYLFHIYGKKNGKYVDMVGTRDIPWDDKGEPQTNLMELLCVASASATRTKVSMGEKQHFSLSKSFRRIGDRTATAARKLRTIFAEPRRLVWVSLDQEEFETLVDKLKDLNSFLIGLLDASHTRRLESVAEMNYLELLQLRDDTKSLRTLIQALDPGTRGHEKLSDSYRSTSYGDLLSDAALIEKADEAKRQYLKNLARLKIRRIEIDQSPGAGASSMSDKPSAMSLDHSLLNIFTGSCHRDWQKRRKIASWDNRNVWVEWIEQPTRRQGYPETNSLLEDRVALLTGLLCEEMPPGFRAPRCLGYIKSPQQNTESDFGIVFEQPSFEIEVDVEPVLTTLHELLDSWPKPPIAARMSLCSALADCLFSFHAVDWLHKGLRSDNVIFFITKTSDPSLDMPYITGYDLSRPSDVPEMTENPLFDPWPDMYRHPDAQFGEAKNFYRKSYDMYSLGIILLEIALWKPIEVILGIKDVPKINSNDLRGIRGKLLGQPEGSEATVGSTSATDGSEYLAKAAHKCGDSYRNILEICLKANEIEKPAYRGESRAAIKSRLRTMFKEQISDKLQLMKEAFGYSR